MIIFFPYLQQIWLFCREIRCYNHEKKGVLSKMTQNYKSNTKITYVFFETLFCPIHPRSSSYSKKCHYFFFFYISKNKAFTLPSSSSTNIYNFVIDINTSTTMNYQFESVNALKFRFFSSFLIFYLHKPHILHFLSKYIKKTEDFDYKLCKLHKLTILCD